MKPISVFACESRPIIVEGLRGAMRESPDLVFAGAAEPEEALAVIAGLRPDVVLIGCEGDLDSALALVAGVRRISEVSRPVLWVRKLGPAECQRALEAGAGAIVSSTLPIATLFDCLRTVGSGGAWPEDAGERAAPRRGAPRLTPREGDIARLVCRGLTNKEIARALSIAPGTVKVHLMHIFEKTGARNRFDLAAAARRWIPAAAGEEAGVAGEATGAAEPFERVG